LTFAAANVLMRQRGKRDKEYKRTMGKTDGQHGLSKLPPKVECPKILFSTIQFTLQ